MMNSPVITVSTPMTRFLYSTLSSEIEENTASRSCEVTYFAICWVEFIAMKILYLEVFVTFEYVETHICASFQILTSIYRAPAICQVLHIEW